MNSQLLKYISIICFLMSISCGAEESGHSVADVCIVVNVDSDGASEIVKQFDEFGSSNNLLVDKSHPVSYEYKDSESRAILSIITHFGPHGIVVSYFRFGDEKGKSLQNRLMSFIRNDIASVYDVEACDDIDGFRPPQIWDKPLQEDPPEAKSSEFKADN